MSWLFISDQYVAHTVQRLVTQEELIANGGRQGAPVLDLDGEGNDVINHTSEQL
jgi:hypothetical protein